MYAIRIRSEPPMFPCFCRFVYAFCTRCMRMAYADVCGNAYVECAIGTGVKSRPYPPTALQPSPYDIWAVTDLIGARRGAPRAAWAPRS